MKIALFTDATVHPTFRKAAIGAACFDVTCATEPTDLFRFGDAIPFCESDAAEKIAALRGLERVLALVRDGLLRAESVLVFTDCSSVAGSPQITRCGVVDRLESLGCTVTFHHIPRSLNRAAHRAAHDVLYPPHPGMLLPREIPSEYATLVSRYPFLTALNY